MSEKRVRVCRLIRPANPQGRVNIYSHLTRITTTFGLAMVATAINKFLGWRVVIIDEENYRGPRDKDGLPNHEVLQQEEPADVVGFYCGLTSTIERVWKLADFYKKQGVITLAGSWHAHYCPEETLRHNIDLVLHGDADLAIAKVFANINENRPLHEGVGGVSFLDNCQTRHILPNLQDAGQIADCDDKRLETLENRLTCEQMTCRPYPDFGLLQYAKIKLYPIGRIQGCSMKCKFCTVKGGVRFANASWLFGAIDWLVKTRGAKNFFLVDDRSEEDLPGTLEFFKMVAERYGRRLNFVVQMRLEAARKTELLAIMKKAGVRTVCIGLESPISEELKAMKKGVTADSMLELLAIWRKHMHVHGMFIFGFPVPGLEKPVSVSERVAIYKRFIKKAKLDYVQVLQIVPLPGSELYSEFKKDGKLYPFCDAPWNKHDGNFVLVKPDEGVNLQELQDAHIKIMAWFYSPLRFYQMVCRTLIYPIAWILRCRESWRSGWGREIIRWLGHRVAKRWQQAGEGEKHIENLTKHS